MTTTLASSSNMASRPAQSCVRCADRKVKCDRQRPCSACVKHNVDCVFNPLVPPRKRHKRVQNLALMNRLRYYEALLQEQGIDPSKLADAPESESPRRPTRTVALVSDEPQLRTPPFMESELNQIANKIQIIQGQGRSKFVDK